MRRQHTRKLLEARQDNDDAADYVRGIATFIAGLTIMTIAVYLLMWGMFKLLNAREEKHDEEPPPMAMTSKERLPPEPRLQSAPGFAEDLEKQAAVKEEEDSKRNGGTATPKDPLWEMKVLREHWKTTLQMGVKDQNGNFVVLPIEEAKKELLKKGLPEESKK